MDSEKIKKGVQLILEGIGETPERVGLVDTPMRVANMCEEIFQGLSDSPEQYLTKVFECDNKEIVLVKDISFYSVCEHHLLPFYGKVSVAYFPDGLVVGLSKIVRLVESYSRRLQIQERLTEQIADAIYRNLKTDGVAVYVEAEHLCMSMRGIQKPGTKTMTLSTKGSFNDAENKNIFMKMVYQ